MQTTFCLALLVAALPCVAALAPNETAPAPGEWGFRPSDGKASAVDPPGFVWRPQGDAASYAIQIARDRDFAQVVEQAEGLALSCHCPAKKLGVGTYFWRFRYVDKAGETAEWSSVRSFSIDASSQPFPMPGRADLLSRVPEQHPRLFLRPEDIATYRELAQGRLKKQWDGIVAQCEKLLKSPPDVSEPLKYQENEKRGVNDDA